MISLPSTLVSTAATSRQDRTSGPVGQYVFRLRRAGQDRDLAPDLNETAQDVPFHAVIESDHVVRYRPQRQVSHEGVGETFRPWKRLARHHLADQVPADNAGTGPGLANQRGVLRNDLELLGALRDVACDADIRTRGLCPCVRRN